MRFEPARRANDDERILPLINVVFLLLIFFMLAGSLAAMDPFEVAPPRSTSEGLDETRDVLVLVGADGQLALDGVPVPAAAFGAALTERLGETEDAARVRLKADGQAEAGRVVAIMERLHEAGVERVVLLTVPDDR
ncbi:ExbD/TolR family protein [Roseospira visakhapatnamensis]|uniref:Biopolymer transport protein ExbD n=1 Tax=Roseospira visakhapatnamensis TaxID=390880 RepID=A0A7W6RET9_9PROT|nr:biopolymer transporter ExbD [Roseospira visakhapatnamensis]MBB4267045.1 biopolymer transport protein ExbD [Roseospira visakhapatnamensis]